MIDLAPSERAELYLAMQRALGTSDRPGDPFQSRRLGLAELVTGYGDDAPFAAHEVLRLADAMETYLVCDVSDPPPFRFKLANVAALVGGDLRVARTALRLVGAVLDHKGEYWTTDPTEAGNVVDFPRGLLCDAIQLELEEAEAFVARKRQRKM